MDSQTLNEVLSLFKAGERTGAAINTVRTVKALLKEKAQYLEPE
ncbi:hypothetical protein [Acaryochloris sp. CCMEE 5410]|nr:hypothetical protein [Acaryochloris sp. CCMEE 5410]